MDFPEFFNLFYIKGYFKSGRANNNQYYSPKPYAVLQLLKGSVAYPDQVSFSKNALDGFFIGKSIPSLVNVLINAEFSTEKMAKHIESLYPNNHHRTTTYNDRHGKRTYRDALFGKVKDNLKDITLENMSEILAKEFFNLIHAAKEESDIEVIAEQKSNIDRIKKLSKNIGKVKSEMITIGRSIAESGDTDKYNGVDVSNLKQRLHQKLSQLSELSSSLYDCNIPDLEEVINDIFIAIQSIDENDFILTKAEFMIISNRNLSLHHFLDVLDQLKNEVENLSNS